MEREIARQTLTTALGYSRKIEESISRVKQRCDQSVFVSYRRFAARVMGYMLTEIIGPIYDEHPDLAPDWYKSKPDVDGKQQVMGKLMHQELTSLMDEVDDGVVQTTLLVDQFCPVDEARRYRRSVDEVRVYIDGVKEYLNNIGIKDDPQ